MARQTTEQAGPGRPVVAAMADGQLMLFVRRADGSVWRRKRTVAGEWLQWNDTGADAQGDPAVGRNLNGGLVVFARNPNHQVIYQVQRPDGSWEAWRSLGTPAGVKLASNPAVAVNDNRAVNASRQAASGAIEGNTDSRSEVFVRGADGKLWHRAQRASDGTGWTEWRSLGAELTGNPTAVVGGDGRIALFSRDVNGRVRSSAQVNPGRPGLGAQPVAQWSAWTVLTTARNIREGEDVAVAVNSIGKFGTLLQVFANNTNNFLWTVTQSSAGTPDNPGGQWTQPENLRDAYKSSPVVAASRDGRLHVFGTRAGDEKIAYRSQVSPVAPADPDLPDVPPDPNGNWHACCTNWTGGPAVTSLTVLDTGTGQLEVFAMGRENNSIYQRRQLTEGHPQAPAGKWRAFVNLNPVNAPCANAGTLGCVTITNPRFGTVLDGTWPRNDDRTVHVAPGTSASATQQWRIDPADGSGVVRIVNRSTGRCLAEDWWWAKTMPCDSGEDRQRWFVEPVATGSTGATPDRFVIRNVHDSNRNCVMARADQAEVWADNCASATGDLDNAWQLGGIGGGTAPGIMDTALTYAAGRCDASGSSCRFVEDGAATPAAYNVAPNCVSSAVVFNSSETSDANLQVSWEQTTGTEFSVSSGLSVELPGGLSASFTAEHTWVQEATAGDSFAFDVPPRHFGWAARALVKRESIGHWEFTINGRLWTLPGHNVAYAKDGTDGRSMGVLTSVVSPAPPAVERCPA